MAIRPGGELARRPLHFIFILDCSGSMTSQGKIQSLNNAIREAIPHMKTVADGNPNADLLVRALKFSSGAEWHISQPTPIDNFTWSDVSAVSGNETDNTDMGRAFSMVADQLKIPPMTDRALPPVLVLISDGPPTDDYVTGLDAIMKQPWGKKTVRIAIAIGQDADNEVLKKFIGNPELEPLQASNMDELVKYICWGSTSVVRPESSTANQEIQTTTHGIQLTIPTASSVDLSNLTSGEVRRDMLKMPQRPGGALAARPLLFEWIVDCSGSMSINGKMASLNTAIRAALPEMLRVAENNPSVDVRMKTITFSHGAKSLNDPVSLHAFEWVDLVADSLAASTSAADVIFLMDTSGSMEGEIEAVRSQCLAFAERITRCGADVHLGLVGFDIGGHIGTSRGAYTVHNLSEYTIGIWPIKTPADFKKHVHELRLGLFGGSGCYLADPSTVEIFPHLIRMFSDSGREARRFVVIVSDEIGSVAGVTPIVEILMENQITCHVLGVSGPSPAHRQIGEKTGGQFWDILSARGNHDFSVILGNVAETIGKEMRQALEDGTISSGTDIGAALRIVAADLEVKNMPPRALPPVLVLISDGRPTDDFTAGLAQLAKQPWVRKSVRLAIGIGADTDTDVLQRFIGNPEVKPMTADNPDTLTRHIRWVSTAILESVSAPAAQLGGRTEKSSATLPAPPQFIADRFETKHLW